MDIVFHCPECGQKIEAPEEYRGVEVVCPICNNTILVPIKRNNAPVKVTQVTQVSQVPQSNYNAGVFTILGLFFGIFGAHNFYKKQYFWGITRILVIIISFFTLLILNDKSIAINHKAENARENYIHGNYKEETFQKYLEEASEMDATITVTSQIIIILHIASGILVIIELAFQNMPTHRSKKTSQ